MLIESASLLLGASIGLIISTVFIKILSLPDVREVILQLWKIIVYLGGAGGVPPLLVDLLNLSSPYIGWYIIGLTITFLIHSLYFIITSKIFYQ